MWNRLTKTVDRLDSILSVWQILRAVLVAAGGVVTGVLSSPIPWINQFGPFGWWVAFLLGSLLTAAVMAFVAYAKLNFVQSRLMQEWSRSSDAINPLDATFHKRRILLTDLAHPLTNRVVGKRFTDCELIGPANLVIMSNTQMQGISFMNCDLVPTKRHLQILNGIGIGDTQIIGGTIVNATLFLHPDVVAVLEASGQSAAYVSLTGNPEIDARKVKLSHP